MKKVICYLVSLFILWESPCTPVLAGESQSLPQILTSSLPNQWRFGLGLAGEYISIEANLKVDLSPSLGADMQSNQSQTGKHLQVAPCFELGATIANDYYLGVLFSWRYSGAKTKSRSPVKAFTHFFHEFKINHYSDILAKPGYKLSPCTMVYGLIGPSIANWTHTTDQFEGQTKNDSLKISKMSIGLGLGFGFEYLVQKKHAFSIDYTHHFHSSTSKQQNMAYYDLNAGGPFIRSGTVYKKIDPSYATIAVRYTYFFNL